jgi:hypothetical protein
MDRADGPGPLQFLVVVAAHVPVLPADDGETISDLSILRNQPGLFGPVASTATAWRVLEDIDNNGLNRLRTARALARERAWLARADLGRSIPTVHAGGRSGAGLVIDLDATLITAHSEKERCRPTFKAGFGHRDCGSTCAGNALTPERD